MRLLCLDDFRQAEAFNQYSGSDQNQSARICSNQQNRFAGLEWHLSPSPTLDGAAATLSAVWSLFRAVIMKSLLVIYDDLMIKHPVLWFGQLTSFPKEL